MDSSFLLFDGNYSTPKKVAPNVVLYPLAADANYQAKEVVETHLVRTSAYSPQSLNTTGVSAGLYLVEERTRDGMNQFGLTEFERHFCNVPNTWTGYSSILLNKPTPNMGALSQMAYGDYWLFTSGTQTVSVYGPAKTVSVVTSQFPTGGAFTLTISGQTTASLAANADAIVVKNALNVLSSVQSLGGLGVSTGSAILSSLNVAFSGSAFFLYGDMTLNTASLLPTGCVASVVRLNNGATQNFAVAPPYLDYTVSSHGLSAGNRFALGTTTTYAQVTSADIASADIFRIPYAAAVLLGTGAFRNFLRTYTQGTLRLRTREAHSYYLPGVTAGITTPEDIPLPAVRSDDYAFLTTIFAGGSGYLIWDASNLSQYRGNIYEQVTTELRVSDV